jgi:hypothetical protein
VIERLGSGYFVTRNRILGAIVTLFGLAGIIYSLTTEIQGEGAYAAGQIGGRIFAIVMFLVGLYYLIKG